MSDTEPLREILDGGVEPEEGTAEELRVAAADPGAPAMALGSGGQAPALPPEAAAYYVQQARLIAIQMEHLHEQRDLTLTHLKMRRISDWMRVALQLATALLVSSLAVVLVALVIGAARSRAVVVAPFDSPASLAARGLSGKVVAGGLLDGLARLQAATHSTFGARTISDSWSDDIKVEVPETGVTFGEVERLLREKLGHDLHVGGDLVQTANGGLALTVRGDGVLPRTFTGPSDSLGALTVQAAEYVYGRAQPALYAAYLSSVGRDADAIAFSRSAFATTPADERPVLLNAWANALGDSGGSQTEVLDLYRAALALKPDYWPVYANIEVTQIALGDEEGAWRTGQAMLQAAGGRPGRASEQDFANWDELTYNLQAQRREMVADAEQTEGVGTTLHAYGINIALVDMALHDPASARFQLETTLGNGGAADPVVAAQMHRLRGLLAADAGDKDAAVTEMEAYQTALKDPAVANAEPGYACSAAPAEEAAGHPDKADAVLKAGGHFLDCYRYRADILAQRGQWEAAQRAYADAVALAPDLPAAYQSWGVALLGHGDLAEAIDKFAAAHERAPHWADPLKGWGDALMRQGHVGDALEKYDAALAFAPHWRALRTARDLAAGMAR
jgi:tetratricopeptide (TPR) repeat protein